MKCKKCYGDKVTMQIVQTKGKTRNVGIGYKLTRWFLILCTCGLWLLVPSKKSNTNFKNETWATCQSCGHSWKV